MKLSVFSCSSVCISVSSWLFGSVCERVNWLKWPAADVPGLRTQSSVLGVLAPNGRASTATCSFCFRLGASRLYLVSCSSLAHSELGFYFHLSDSLLPAWLCWFSVRFVGISFRPKNIYIYFPEFSPFSVSRSCNCILFCTFSIFFVVLGLNLAVQFSWLPLMWVGAW